MVRKRGRKARIFQNYFQFLKVHFSKIICFTALRVPETACFALLFTMFNNSFFSDWLEKNELMLMRKETADWNLPIILLRGDASQFHSFFLSIPVEQESKNKLKCSINSPSWCRQPPVSCREFEAVCRLHPFLLNRWRCCDYAGSLPLLSRESQEENVLVQ